MNKESAKKALDGLQSVYVLEEKKLKTLKQLEISLKGALLGVDISNSKFSLLPDHDKNFHRINDDVIVGLVNTDTQEKLYFNEPVFNVKTISIHNPELKYGLGSDMTIAEKYLYNLYKKSKNE